MNENPKKRSSSSISGLLFAGLLLGGVCAAGEFLHAILTGNWTFEGMVGMTCFGGVAVICLLGLVVLEAARSRR